MKKILITLMMIIMLVSLSACGSKSNNDTSMQDQPSTVAGDSVSSMKEDSDLTNENALPSDGENIQNENTSDEFSESSNMERSSNILVAYFSRVGNTVWDDDVDVVTSASLNVQDGEYVGNAQMLAQMAQEITGGDLFLIETVDTYPSDYRDTTDLAAEEQSNDARPALASHVENMDQYDTIVLIYPNWWGTLPQPLFTFLEEYDFSGKTILPLCTHEGSRMGSSTGAIATMCPDAVLLEGLDVRGANASSAKGDVEEWINHSGILD